MAVAAICAVSAWGEITATDAFVSAPQNIFPLLDANTRMDMVDYFNSGSDKASVNALKGKSRVVSIDPQKLEVNMTDASSNQVIVLPTKDGELIGLIATVATPAPDSNLNVFSSDWTDIPTEQVFTRPLLADWLSAEGKKNQDEVEMMVPFLLVSYDYEPSSKTLTLTNNTKDFLSEDIYEMVAPYLLPMLKYVWNGKKFVNAK